MKILLMHRSPVAFGLLCLVATFALEAEAQQMAGEPSQAMVADVVAGLPLREIGPALMGGRISDVEVHPHRRSTWYVAAGSGGVWKTTNAGVTWEAIFENQPVYSIGDIALDPRHPDVVWVGTGENVSGRHVGWGDGIYRSRNGGDTWENVGLRRSEHIGKILIDPRDSRVVLVAAEGPLWTSGGDRGVYRSTDGGDSWQLVLEIDENTGVTDIEFAPGNPNIVYAAAYERRRKIWGHLAGGPNSGIYKSTDGGESWRRISTGLPKGDVGKIGLAVTPANPEVVYATMEADEEERGFYRSLDEGESWERRNSYISGGTGPHYYQEIEASPHDADVVYQMDVFLHVTRDGGATFEYLETGSEKHSDNHALWIDPDDGMHLIVGTDAGVYETFDDGRTFRHIPNLPISQFYKLTLDTAEPFYHILGGAQDLGTLWGPARTMNVEGIRNRDWYVPMGADGYAVQIDPTDPDILYLQTQQGNLYRYDRKSEEALDIQPQPAPGDPPERFNWDSPVLISPHDTDRIYHGSQRLWMSEDRGNSWTAISGDLTTNANRYELEFMGRVWSVDDLIDNGAMSKYSTLTGISESPVAPGVIYAGSDDGLIHVTEDAGDGWRLAAELPGVPARAFINDVEASQHDGATVFAVADNHKEGDFRPLIFESNDRGRTWRSIAGDLPEEMIAWAIEQDHESPNLLFLGAEFGLYVSVNGGTNWHKLPGPTIPHRDLEIQRRESDVVGATFGRGFYALDDYTPLRELAAGRTVAAATGDAMAGAYAAAAGANGSMAGRSSMADGGDGSVTDGGATLFPVRDAWWYVPQVPMQSRGKPTLGSDDYTAPNPDFGALLAYYLPEALTETLATAAESRRAAEEDIRAEGGDVPFPGYDALNAEATETGARALVAIRDGAGRTVRWVPGPAGKGLHRVNWDLRASPPDPIDLSVPGFTPPWATPPQGPLVAPGEYSAQLVLVAPVGGPTRMVAREVGEPQSFAVQAVPTSEAGTDYGIVVAFQAEAAELMRRVSAGGAELARANDRLRHMRAALLEAPAASLQMFGDLDGLAAQLHRFRIRLYGDPARQQLNESTAPTIGSRVGRVIFGHWGTRQLPTATQRRSLNIADTDFTAWLTDFQSFMAADFLQAETALEAAGAPWTPARPLPRQTPASGSARPPH